MDSYCQRGICSANQVPSVPSYLGCMNIHPLHRSPILLELDLTELPIDPDPETRWRGCGHAAAGSFDRRCGPCTRPATTVGRRADRQGRRAAALGRDAGAADRRRRPSPRAGSPRWPGRRRFGEESGGTCRRTCWPRRSTRSGCSRAAGSGLLGVGLETTFLRGALDKLGIEPQFEQRYEYKNAADRVMRTEFTPAHRESLERLTESIFAEAVEAIAAGRQLRQRVGSASWSTPDRGHGRRGTRGRPGRPARLSGPGVRRRPRAGCATGAELLFADRWQPRPAQGCPPAPQGHVALVEVRGGIGSGRTRRGPWAVRSAATRSAPSFGPPSSDDRARAVVLRVDSPGGSAVASDTIWREVCRVREAGKPVVVSMGDAAASGRLLHRLPGRRHRRAAVDPDRLDRGLRRQVRGARAAGADRA